jgi:hypothetical protein
MKSRNSKQIAGVRAQLVGAINACDNDAYVQVNIKIARNLVEICDQAIHTEKGHEPSLAEIEGRYP